MGLCLSAHFSVFHFHSLDKFSYILLLLLFFRLARLLTRVFPELAIDVMEGEEYLGASALHLAIAYSNNELVNDLIDAGADVHQRAIGRFFLPRDQQSNNPAKQTDYEGLAYFGEYPLAWAACVNNESVYNLL